MRILHVFLPALAGCVLPALAGCGDDDGGSGGYARFALVAEESGEPIAGGEIVVDGASIGTTDASGTLEGEYNDGHLVGAVGTAAGRASGAYHGTAQDEITITLASATAPPVHAVSGSIDGWDALPAPAAGHRFVALVVRSRPASEVMVDGVGAVDPIAAAAGATCVRDSAMPVPCTWSLDAPEGTWSFAAAIVDIDGMGTPATDDDTVASVQSFAIVTDVAVAADVSGVVLAPAAAVTLAAMVPDPGGGLSEVIGVPGVGTGGTVLVFPVAAIPELTGPLAGARAWVIGEARGPSASALRVARGVTPGGEVALATLPTPPEASITSGVITLNGDGARMVRYTDASGVVVWTARLEGRDASELDPAGLGLAAPSGGAITALTLDPSSAATFADVEGVGRTTLTVP